jgi:hypothetical protein
MHEAFERRSHAYDNTSIALLEGVSPENSMSGTPPIGYSPEKVD